jgi:hypothetical protein
VKRNKEITAIAARDRSYHVKLLSKSLGVFSTLPPTDPNHQSGTPPRIVDAPLAARQTPKYSSTATWNHTCCTRASPAPRTPPYLALLYGTPSKLGPFCYVFAACSYRRLLYAEMIDPADARTREKTAAAERAHCERNTTSWMWCACVGPSAKWQQATEPRRQVSFRLPGSSDGRVMQQISQRWKHRCSLLLDTQRPLQSFAPCAVSLNWEPGPSRSETYTVTSYINLEHKIFEHMAC